MIFSRYKVNEMDKQPEFGPAPPTYNEATAPPCQTVPPQALSSQPYPQEQHEPLLQQPYPQLHQPNPYPEKQPLPQQQPPYPSQPSYPPQQPYPQPQQPYPPQPSPVPQSMVIRMSECHGPVSFGMAPVHMVCPNCHNQISSSVVSESKEGDGCKVENHLACIVMFIIGCFILVTWFCSCLPYIFNKDKSSCTYRHSCPRCNVLLGTYVHQ